MKEKIKTILIGILIGFIAFPTLTLGGTFVVSLIQGKSVEEAVQILAEQIDALLGRIEQVEEKQQIMQTQLEKEKICREYRELLDETPRMTRAEAGRIDDPIKGIDIYLEMVERGEIDADPEDVARARANREPLLLLKQKCEQ